MAINLGPEFEAELIQLAGWNPDLIDPGSTEISLVNPAGPTTIRATIVGSADTAALNTLIRKYTS